MTHSGRFEREYFCHKCHLQYCGYFDPSLGGREPCPHCGEADPCAVDTFSHCYCWVSNPARQRPYLAKGRNVWKETAWWREEWMKPDWIELYRGFEIPNEPRPEALKEWHRKERKAIRGMLRRASLKWAKREDVS